MAVTSITIDERIKTSQSVSAVTDYKGTLIVCDSNGIKIFNGSNLQLVYSINVTSSIVVVDDYLYYGAAVSDYALYKYNFVTGVNTKVASTTGSINNVLYKDGKIYIFHLYYRSGYMELRYKTYDINTGSVSNDTEIESSSSSYYGSQMYLDDDYNLYYAYDNPGVLRTLNIKTGYSGSSYSVCTGISSFGLYKYDKYLISTFGYKAQTKKAEPTIREYDPDSKTIKTETIQGFTSDDSLSNKYVGFWDGAYCIATSKGLVKIRYVTYSLTYSFYDASGDNLLYSISGKYPITSLSFAKNDDNISFTFNTLDGTVTGGFTAKAPEGKSIKGISLKAGSRAAFLFGIQYNVSIYENCNFYLSLITDRPPATTFDINLYQNSAEVNRVDKSEYLTSVGTLQGALREECSIISPSITFKQTTVPTFNYVYIGSFGRYYYVTGITSVAKDLWRMSLSCDVLMTWKEQIGNMTAIIARQENSFNPMLIDSELPAQANKNITVAEFPAGGFSTESAIAYPFILTVVGA